MKIEKTIGNMQEFDTAGKMIDKVYFEWYELEKKLFRKTSEGGVELGISLDTHLHEGDVLYADESKVIVVDLLPADLTVIPVNSMQEMGRLCFELGNRHLSLKIEEDRVSVPYDEPTFTYLEKLGFHPERKEEKFSHFTVCHAHGHSHGGEEHHNHAHSHA